jgi:sugar diacid utilization regulator
MWILLSEFDDIQAASAMLSDELTIESVRIFALEDELCPDYVYVGRSNDFFKDNRSSVILVHRKDVAIVNETDVSVVLNKLVSIFDKYHAWEKQLLDAMRKVNPYQSVLEAAHEVFRCPMFFGHKDLRIYALTEQYSDAEVYDGWDDVKVLHTMPDYLLKHTRPLDMSKYPDEMDVVAIPVENDPTKHFKFQIRANVYHQMNIWGHLYLYYGGDVVPPAFIQLMREVAKLFSQIIASSEYRTSRYEQFSFLVDILDGRQVDVRQVEPYYDAFHLQKNASLVLVDIASEKPDFTSVLFDWFCDSIADYATNTIVFPYKNSIVVIMQKDDGLLDALLSYSMRLNTRADFRCGISFEFQGIENIATHYFQASYALKIPAADGGKIHRFSEDAFGGIIQAFRENIHWQDFIFPALKQLIAADKENNTEYFNTLCSVLICQNNFALAAKALYIHRNTVRYRMAHIEQALGVDLQNKETWVYLHFCCMLLTGGDAP